MHGVTKSMAGITRSLEQSVQVRGAQMCVSVCEGAWGMWGLQAQGRSLSPCPPAWKAADHVCTKLPIQACALLSPAMLPATPALPRSPITWRRLQTRWTSLRRCLRTWICRWVSLAPVCPAPAAQGLPVPL